MALGGRATVGTGAGAGPWRAALRRFRRDRAAVAAAAALGALALAGLGAGVIAPYSPARQLLVAPAAVATPADPLAPRVTGKYAPPSRAHLFGTDQLARDIFSRTLYGLRISLAAAAFAMLVTAALGVGVGALAGAGPRWLDALLMRATDAMYAFPDLLLMILLGASFGARPLGHESLLGVQTRLWLLFGVIGVTAWPTAARLVRGQLLALRGSEFALAAEAIGASPWRRVTRHLLPNALGPLLVEVTFVLPRAIAAEATLSFIGVGASPPTPSLGLLIRDHFEFAGVQWTALAIPTALLALLFLAMQVAGEGLRDALDPRSGARGTAR